ncbi:phosphopantetheine-binding protein [Nonomuraea ferruginea]|uniref:Phosphopantetheine-binding protein n=1 Tax=Nonomuraea ferruginea TaxID=46174 RepID=A0ABT4T761_9ACTN|nr:phosphopantetheine-binding protein [Nonomuraea ferruginea]MDA0644990.1 phosphopantetheine-binding protein [Nonomuraea ferruginea]
MDVKARVRSYLRQAVMEEVGDGDDLFELGLVNSLFALQLVQFVENEFSIKAEREDLDIVNFSSIDALTAFVLRKTQPPFGPGHAAD